MEASDEADPANLSCAGTGLTQLPALAGSLTSVDLSSNAIASVAGNALAPLVRLRSLDLSHNALASLPAELGALAALERLDVRHNALTTLPAGLGSAAACGARVFVGAPLLK